MTKGASKFIHISPKDSGHVTYGDNNKGKILGVRKLGTNPFTFIENVLPVDGLKHSLLRVSQLCDKGFLVSFDSHNFFIESKHDKKIKHVGLMCHYFLLFLNLFVTCVKCFFNEYDTKYIIVFERIL